MMRIILEALMLLHPRTNWARQTC